MVALIDLFCYRSMWRYRLERIRIKMKNSAKISACLVTGLVAMFASFIYAGDSHITWLSPDFSPVGEMPHHSALIDAAHDVDALLAEFDGIYRLCSQLDQKLTSISLDTCLDANLQPSGAFTNRQRVIALRDFLPESGDPVGRVLLIGGIHGDEYSSVTIVFRWLKQLSEQQGGPFHWRVVPLMNPDGLLMPPGESQRMNANGVDLNRNFPTPNWQEEATDYWVNRTRKSKRRYPGTAPLSEPESRWLAEQIEEFQPDAVISVHAPHGIVDFDGPQVPPNNLGPLELRLLGTYPGSMGRYIGVFKSIPILTVELESALRLPDSDDVDRIWHDTIAWLNHRVAPLEKESQSAGLNKSGGATSARSVSDSTHGNEATSDP